MNFLKSLIGAVTGSFYGYIAAAVIGAGVAGAAVYWVQDLRLDAVKSNLETVKANAARDVENAQGDTKQCTDALEKQNKGIEEIKKRADAAEAAMKKAEALRTAAEKKATEILQERTPANVDACVAARDAFAAELKQERGQ